jgi:hypothetical protein
MECKNIAALFCSTVMLTACGGGGGDNEDTASRQLNATVIDDYLSGATVWLDMNNNFKWDDNEPSALSGSGGKVAIDLTGIDNPSAYPLVVKATTDKTIDQSTNDFVTHNFVM